MVDFSGRPQWKRAASNGKYVGHEMDKNNSRLATTTRKEHERQTANKMERQYNTLARGVGGRADKAQIRIIPLGPGQRLGIKDRQRLRELLSLREGGEEGGGGGLGLALHARFIGSSER
ncbi:hypothetical protein PoB_007109600 [Plakobranchus ocellatus]|uniref:Uncharacterized protein n=1 Tax=Plakobranchus ocellatus TaxID=259542 RepID=A0AAV4DKV3_9GAST|nr:hypothetical protein PoB_007109600 [Plakobranchus ocellatus]